MLLRVLLSYLDPVPLVCAITGLPAKYKDPLTGKPYANAQALQALRRGRA